MLYLDKNEFNETEFGYRDILSILFKQKRIFISILFSIVVISILFTYSKPNVYESSMKLLVDQNFPDSDPLSSESSKNNSNQSSTDISTQLNIMRSDIFIDKLRQSLENGYPRITSEEIKSSLSIENTEENKQSTKIIKLVYRSDSAIKSQRALTFLRIIFDNYINQQQRIRLAEGLKLTNEQLQDARNALATAQSKTRNFRKQYSLIDPNQEGSAQANALNQVNQDLRTLRAQIKENQGRYDALQNQIGQTPGDALNAAKLTQSKRYQKQLDQIKDIEQELANKKSIFTDQNPAVQNLLEQRQKQINLLEIEKQRILGQDTSSASVQSNRLLSSGQLSGVDLTNVENLSALASNLSGLKAREAELVKTKSDLEKQLNQFPDYIAEYERLQPEAELSSSLVKKLLEQRQTLSERLSRAGFTWQLIEPPSIGIKVGPNHLKDILLGMVLGVFLGGTLIFIAEGLTKTDQSINRSKLAHNLQVLGSIPEIYSGEDNPGFHENFDQNSFPTKFKVFQLLNNSLFQSSIDIVLHNLNQYRAAQYKKSLAITSTFSKEGKTFFAMGLAFCSSQLSLKTLIIDINLSSSSFFEYVNTESEKSEFQLVTPSLLMSMITTVTFPNTSFDVLSTGLSQISFEFTNFMNSGKFLETLRLLESEYDLILLDMPSVSNSKTIEYLSKLQLPTMLLVQTSRVNQATLNQTLQKLEDVNCIGLVSNKHSKISNTEDNHL